MERGKGIKKIQTNQEKPVKEKDEAKKRQVYWNNKQDYGEKPKEIMI